MAEDEYTMKVMSVFGTRPEAIKMCPIVKELQKRDNIKSIVCVTGQHRQMLQQVLSIFNVEPDYNLDIMKEKQTLFDITINILKKIGEVLESENPDVVLVHGDTTTAFATSLACFYKGVAVGHVEAGLRTYNMESPFPEEFNRQAIDLTSKFYFAPTEHAKKNLLNEMKAEQQIFVTGNTVIDALKTTIVPSYEHNELTWTGDSRLILVTAHRRENIGQPMRNMFRAMRKICMEFPDVKLVYPIHMNPIVRTIADEELSGMEQVHIIEPLDVFDFHNFMEKSYLILTDSGGIQEEAPALGKPVLVMRDTTERPEGVEAGTLKLVGTDEEPIYEACKKLLQDEGAYSKMANAVNPYGDGFASKRIVDILIDKFN